MVDAVATTGRPDRSAEPDAGQDAPPGDLSARLERVVAPLREQVVELLRNEIVELRLQPGQRLIERELMERVGVSRTTIREVLRQLAAEGLVTTIPQKGTMVARVSAKEAAELYEVRALLEGAAARECALNASDAQIRALRSRFTEIERSEPSHNAAETLRAKNRFYNVLFDGAGNMTIRTILTGLQARIATLRTMTLTVPGRTSTSIEEIRVLMNAIERRDAEAAGQAASYHVRQAAQTLLAQLEGSPDGDQPVLPAEPAARSGRRPRGTARSRRPASQDG